MKNIYYILIFLTTAVLLISCGGGGGKNIYFKGELPPIKTITITEDGKNYDIEAVSGHILMYFKDGVSLSKVKKIIAAEGGKIIEQMPKFDYYLIEVAEGTENDFINRMRQNSSVEYVFLNTLIQPFSKIYILDNYEPNSNGWIHGEEVKKMFEKHSTKYSNLYDIKTNTTIREVDKRENLGFWDNEARAISTNIQKIMLNANNSELTLINISLGVGVRDESRKLEDENGRDINFYTVGEEQRKNYIKNAKDFFKKFETTIKKAKKSKKTNFIIVNASGNNGILDLDKLIIDKLDLSNNFLLVSAYDEKDIMFSNNVEYKRSFTTTIDITEEPYTGTSFAAPKLAAWINVISNEYKCLNAQDILQAIRLATPSNPKQPLDEEDLKEEARKIAKEKGCDKEKYNLVGTKWEIIGYGSGKQEKIIIEFKNNKEVKTTLFSEGTVSKTDNILEYMYDTKNNQWKMNICAKKIKSSKEKEKQYYLQKQQKYYPAIIDVLDDNKLSIKYFDDSERVYYRVDKNIKNDNSKRRDKGNSKRRNR